MPGVEFCRTYLSFTIESYWEQVDEDHGNPEDGDP
jgi:hypothetical protein